jgi:hypothetical protein
MTSLSTLSSVVPFVQVKKKSDLLSSDFILKHERGVKSLVPTGASQNAKITGNIIEYMHAWLGHKPATGLVNSSYAANSGVHRVYAEGFIYIIGGVSTPFTPDVYNSNFFRVEVATGKVELLSTFLGEGQGIYTSCPTFYDKDEGAIYIYSRLLYQVDATNSTDDKLFKKYIIATDTWIDLNPAPSDITSGTLHVFKYGNKLHFVPREPDLGTVYIYDLGSLQWSSTQQTGIADYQDLLFHDGVSNFVWRLGGSKDVDAIRKYRLDDHSFADTGNTIPSAPGAYDPYDYFEVGQFLYFKIGANIIGIFDTVEGTATSVSAEDSMFSFAETLRGSTKNGYNISTSNGTSDCAIRIRYLALCDYVITGKGE